MFLKKNEKDYDIRLKFPFNEQYFAALPFLCHTDRWFGVGATFSCSEKNLLGPPSRKADGQY